MKVLTPHGSLFPNQKKINVCIADDHPSYLQGITTLLEFEGKIAVIGSANNGVELLSLLENKDPDIIITDLQMPKMNGFELIPILKAKHPKKKIVVLSYFDSGAIIKTMIQKGVNAYLPKDTDMDKILFTVEKVHTEGYYFSENVTKHIIPGICKNNIDDTSGGPLNLREREILELLCNGLTNKEVSDKLHISEDGVAFHRRNLNKKADAKSFADLVKYAIRNGITAL